MKYFIISLSFLINSLSVYADSVFVYSKTNEEKFIGDYLYILEDPTNALSFEEIKEKGAFVKSGYAVPVLGFKKSTIWIKCSIQNNTGTAHLLLKLAAPLCDKVIFYSPVDSMYSETALGQFEKFDKRKYKQPAYVFDLTLKKGEIKTYYFKLNSFDPIEIPITISSPEEFIDKTSSHNTWFGIYTGLMVIMILYNLFIYFTVRDKNYLYYVVYIISVTLTQTTFLGYTFKYLWPDFPGLETQAILLCSIFVGFASVQFLRKFLNTKQLVPKLDRVFLYAYGLYIISFFVTVFGLYNEAWALVSFIVTPLSVFMLFVAIKLARRGNRTAKFFALAWSIFLFGVFIHAFKDFGVLPYNYFTKYTMPVGSAIETVLLSFALADRINVLKKEKEESQKAALDAARENEKIISEQNIVLEKKVKERTLELETSNHNLIETQAQLVDAEKMASLGQLTAGIAHEINNPINFVKANIEPLKNDIEDILKIQSKYNELKSSSNVENIIKEVEDLKEELDYDYLIKEINKMLQGIELGASRTAQIVRDLQVFSRNDGGAFTKADIHEGIDATLSLLHNLLNASQVKVVKDYGQIPLIDCHPGKLNQVFMNLLNNAIHAVYHKNLPAGEGQIMISTKREQDKVIVTIKDNGIGIPLNIQKKIFDPFFTTKKVGEGTGLGLSIVYGIIKNHNGEIKLESEENNGATFTITLPIDKTS